MAGTSAHGIRDVAFGIVDNKGKIIADPVKGVSASGVFVVDGDGEGATTANITNLEEAGTQKWANNQVKRIAHGKAKPQVALTFLDMPNELLQKLKGYVKMGAGYVLSSAPKPHVAMLLRAQDFYGNDVYEAFANGELIEAGHSHGTDNEKSTEADTVLTYQAIAPIPDETFADDRGEQQPFKYFNSGDEGFDKVAMLKEVFGGFTGDLKDKDPKDNHPMEEPKTDGAKNKNGESITPDQAPLAHGEGSDNTTSTPVAPSQPVTPTPSPVTPAVTNNIDDSTATKPNTDDSKPVDTKSADTNTATPAKTDDATVKTADDTKTDSTPSDDGNSKVTDDTKKS